MQPQYLGNIELLKMTKVGFLASRHTAPASVLPTLDWAAEIRRRENVAVISGFQSPLERQVLDILLQGRCGIIYVQNRSVYKTIPDRFANVITQNRLLFASLTPQYVVRPSQRQALQRNRFIVENADELIFASVSPTSSLNALFNPKKKIFRF